MLPKIHYFFLCVAVIACGPEQEPQESASIPFDDYFEAPDACLEEWEEMLAGDLAGPSCVGTAVAVVKYGSTKFLKGYGLKSRNGTDTTGVNTVFRVGSLSKGFAGVAAGILVDQGLIEWDDPVSKHLPYFTLGDSATGTPISVRNILSHTTGLTRHAYTNLIEEGQDVETIGRALNHLPVIGRIGYTYAYQNASFALIGEIVQRKTGQPFEQFLKKEIFEPLDMHNASATYEDIVTCDDHALPHSYRTRPMRISRRYYNSVASGGINASIADMAIWLEFLINGNEEVISDQVLAEVFEPDVRTRRQRRYYNRWPGVRNSHYAKGWRVIEFRNYILVHHGGYVNGFRSEIAFDRENKVGFCALFNSPCRESDNVVPDFFRQNAACHELFVSR